MDKDNIIFACEEHIDIAIDDYVNSKEEAPQMRKASETGNVKCSYCDKLAEYEILT